MYFCFSVKYFHLSDGDPCVRSNSYSSFDNVRCCKSNTPHPCAMCHVPLHHKYKYKFKDTPPLHLSVVIFIIFIKTIIHPHHVNIHVSSIVIVQKSNCLDVSYRVDFAPFCQILSEICKFRDNDGITVLQQLSSDFPQWQWRAAGVW